MKSHLTRLLLPVLPADHTDASLQEDLASRCAQYPDLTDSFVLGYSRVDCNLTMLKITGGASTGHGKPAI